VHVVEFCVGGQSVKSSYEGVEETEAYVRTTTTWFSYILYVLSKKIFAERKFFSDSCKKDVLSCEKILAG
jgi:hypothetical protein